MDFEHVCRKLAKEIAEGNTNGKTNPSTGSPRKLRAKLAGDSNGSYPLGFLSIILSSPKEAKCGCIP